MLLVIRHAVAGKKGKCPCCGAALVLPGNGEPARKAPSDWPLLERFMYRSRN
jgi:hypothetical protein